MASAASALVAGSLQKVLITGVTPSAHAFVQLDTEDAYSLPQLSTLIQADAASSAAPMASHWSRGDECVAVYGTTNEWYRARVTTAKRNSVDVFFFDYGNSDTVENAKVRPLKPRFAELPAQAIECVLNDVEAVGGKLDEQSFRALAEALLDNELTVKILRTGSVIGAQIVEDPSGVGDFIEKFVKNGFLRRNVSASNLKEGEKYNVYVACVADPHEFWIQLDQNADKLESLMQRIEELYSYPGHASAPAYPGTVCCARYSKDNAWYRAEVMQVHGSNARVRFFDYGNSEIVEVTKLKQLDPSVSSEFPMAICCALDCVEPIAGSQWSRDVVQVFSSVVIDKPLECTIEKIEVGKPITVSLVDSFTHRPVIEELLGRQVVKRGASAVPAQYTSIKLAENQQEEMYVTSVDSPSQYWCQLVSSADDIEALMASLASYYSSTNRVNTPVMTPGTPCCSQYTEDDAWYRAIVTGVEPGNKVKVFYVDYGNQETVPLSRIQVLDPQFVQLPIQAISCGLSGIQPASGSNWDAGATAMIQELSDAGSLSTTVISVIEKSIGGWAHKHCVVDLTFTKQGRITSVADELVKMRLAMKEGHSVSGHVQDLEVGQATLRQKEMMEVEVTFAINPGEFWCCSYTGTADLVPVMKALKAHCESSTSRQLKVQTGILCAARYSVDGEWYRARVKHSPQSGRVSVYFLDYGNSAVVAEADLREIGSQLLSLPAQAIQCGLRDVHPSTGNTWSQTAISAFQRLVSDKLLFAISLGQTTDGVSEVKLVDTTSDDDLDIGLELVKLGVAKFSTSISQGVQSAVAKYKSQSLSDEQSLVVTIVTVENPQSFWCQLIDEKPQADLTKVMSDMADYYSQLKQGQNVLRQFKVGMPCAAQYTEDDGWYRAEIIARRGDLFEVQYVDYGNSELLRPERLRALQPAFGALPPVAFCCQLHGVAPTGPVWLSRARTELDSLGKDKSLTAKVKSVDPQGKVTLELYEGDINLAEQLVRTGSAAKVGVGMPQSPSNSVGQQHDRSPNKPTSQGSEFTYIVQSLNVGQVEKMVVSYVTSPSEIWCQSPIGKTLLEQMQACIQTFYDRIPPGKANLDQATVGMACVAKSPSVSAWYRAVIKRVLQQDEVEVHYVDYGNLELVPLKDVKKVHPDFKKVPTQALPCCLYQCSEPTSGWRDSDRVSLDTLVAETEMTGEVKSVQNSPLKYIVDMKFERNGKKVTVLDAFLSATGRGTSPPASSHSSQVQEVTSMKSPPRDEERTSPSQLVEPLKIDLTSPALRIGVYEDVCIIGVKTVDQIWCQLLSMSDQLAQLSENIALYVETVQQPLSSPSVGLFCLAQYSDGAYYRCHIKKIHAASDVEVFFVDYGNVETVKVKSLKPISRNLCDLAAQAFICRLAGVKPKQPGRWSQEASAYLEKLTIGQQLVARRVPAHDIAVELFDTSDSKMDKKIGDELVAAGFAYSDPGSQSIELKAGVPALGGVQITVPKAVINHTHMLPGKEYHVLVTHVSSPLKFYCQIQKDADEFAIMTDELHTYCSSLSEEQGKIGPLETAVGQYVAALYSVDGGWYRGRVTSIADHQNQMIRVYFVDYGNEEIISLSSVKCLKQSFTTLHALCFEAKLDLVSSDISSKDVALFTTAVTDKEFSCRVLSSDGCGCSTVQLIHRDRPVNVAEELGFKATVSPPKAPPSRIVDFTHPRLLESSTIKVFGTVCEESGRFWCQMTNNVHTLEALMAKIEDHYGPLGTNEEALTVAIVESACCAKFSGDQAWYRAKITGFEGNKVVVRYVDYGNGETVPLANVKILNSKFAELPAQAVYCQLAEICDINKLSENIVEQFRQLIADQELDLVIRSVTGPGQALVEIPSLTEQFKELGIIKTKTSKFEQVESSFRFLQVETTRGFQEEVYVSHIDSPDAVWCQLVSQAGSLEILQQELSEFYSSSDAASLFVNMTTLGPESACCALYSVDESWCRAKVIGTVDQDVSVCFIDYGNSAVVPASAMKPLLRQFSNLPAQAFQCTVSGLHSCHCDEVRRLSVEKTFVCRVTDAVEQTTVDLSIKDEVEGKLVNILDLFTSQEVESIATAKLNQLEVAKDSVGQVYISHVVSPSQFFCQYVSHEDQLSAMMDQIAQYCSDAGTRTLRSRAIGSACLAKYSEDDQFYRAEIQHIGEKTCDVIFVDYGDTDNVLFDDLKEITSSLLQLPCMCIQASLAGTEGQKWDKITTEQFSKLTQAEAVSCHFVEQINGVWYVDIKTEAGLVKIDELDVDRQPLSVLNHVDSDMSIPQIQMVINSTVDVLVTYVVDPLTFYIQLQSHVDDLNSLKEKLAENYISLAEDDLVVQSPVEGMTCCAQFSADQQWYRAIIMRVAGSDCVVHFIDYGNQETVPLSRIKELKKDLLTIPAQAVLCSLAGVKPPDSGWSDAALSFFYESVTDKKLAMTVINKRGNKNVTQLLYPESQELVSKRLSSAGHALSLDATVPVGTERIGVIPNGLSAPVTADINSDSELNPEDIISDTFTVLQWSIGDSFDVTVALINNLDSFVCNPVSSASELEKLMDKLSLSCAEATLVGLPKEQLVVKAACAAQYSGDGKWYRAKIINVLEDSATVAFVDYGNTETVSKGHLLPLNPELQQLPAQAIHCCMADIVSPTLDEGWSDEAWTVLNELTADKVLSCTVSSLQPDGVYEVRLTNVETGEILQDQLIAKGVAIREATELGTNTVLQWQTGENLVVMDRTLTLHESNKEEVMAISEIPPDIMQDVPVGDIENGNQYERVASPVQPDLVTNKVADDNIVAQVPLIQPDVVVAQVDLIAKPLAEPEISPEEPDIQKSARLSQQQEATALPKLIVSESYVIDGITGKKVDLNGDLETDEAVEAEVNVSESYVADGTAGKEVRAEVKMDIETDEDEAVEAERVHPNNKVVVISHIVRAESVEATRQPTDILEYESAKSIADELVESVIQSAIDILQYERHQGASETDASIPESVDRVDGELVCDSTASQSSDDRLDEQLQQVVITHVEDDGHFWARIGEEEDHQEYLDLVEKLNDRYGPLEVPDDADEEASGEEQQSLGEATSIKDETTTMKETHSYSVGDLCAVPWMEDGQWYRGKVIGIITDVIEGDNALVQLIDSGQVQTVSLSLLRPLVTPYGNPPEFATYCALAGVEPGSDGWSHEVKTFLSDLSTNKIIYGREENLYDEEVTLLHLYAPSDELKGVSFQIYSCQLPLVSKISGAHSDVDSTRVEIGSFRDLQDTLSLSSFAISERESPPLPALSEDKEVSALPDDSGEDTQATDHSANDEHTDAAATAVAIEVADASVVNGDSKGGDDGIDTDNHFSDVLHVGRKPKGYIYVNKLIVDQGLAKRK